MLIGEHLIYSLGVIPACVDRRTFHMLIGEHLIYIHSVSYRRVLIGEHFIHTRHLICWRANVYLTFGITMWIFRRVLTQYSAVITSLCSSVSISVQSHIPLSAYDGRRTFRIYPLGV